MTDECPHCYARVIAKADGECPACHRNIRDLTGTDPTRTQATLLHGAKLPPFCCDCGAPTDRYVKVKSTMGGPGGSNQKALWGALAMLCSFSLGLLLMGALRREQLSKRPNDVAVIHMPQCEPCGSVRRPAPIRVDTEQLALTFVVHREFKAHLGEGTASEK
jgi:hypothetical protein